MSRFLLKIPFLVTVVACLMLGISLFTLPSQNQSVAQASFKPMPLRSLEFELPSPAPYPLKTTALEAPVLTATGAAVLDRKSGVFLFTKNPDLRLLPASTVKIMTALLSLEQFSPLEVLMVPQVNDEGQNMGLVKGELITVEALLYGLLVSSANDAAEVLSRNYPGGQEKFVAAMNEKAQHLSLKNTFFANSTGLDNGDEAAGEKRSFSSVRDLAWLTDLSLENETFQKIVATRRVTLRDPQQKFFHPLSNLNELLWTMPEVRGVKTGWTEAARECLVTFVVKDGRELVVVVLGSEDRFGESRRLINWIFANFDWGSVPDPVVMLDSFSV